MVYLMSVCLYYVTSPTGQFAFDDSPNDAEANAEANTDAINSDPQPNPVGHVSISSIPTNPQSIFPLPNPVGHAPPSSIPTSPLFNQKAIVANLT